MLFIVVEKETEALVKNHRGGSVISYPSCTENRQVGALNASSTFWYPSPITILPTKPFLSTLSRAVRFWYGGRCNIEGRSVCALNLISQHSSLPLPVEPFDWCPFEKRALGLIGALRRGRGDQSCLSAAWERSFLEHDSWLQSVIMVFN